ncbi:MAG: NIPSNAP family protein [Bacteroidales bacterium]|nr:NIPSNAP family protein [Bacteroidales bacterium]MCF8404126.1 NIPSNAP family protein [Bacteroidales bacterium]
MKRRQFIKGSALIAGAAVSGTAAAGMNQSAKSQTATNKEIYEWRVYHFKNSGGKKRVDDFYKTALIPTLNKFGVKVGAFGEYDLSDPPTVYYLLVYPSPEEYQKIKNAIWEDSEFIEKSNSYFENSAENGTYTRFETYLMEAFDAIPKMRMPNKERGILELRTYESNNEEAGQRKIKMFNTGELQIFDEVGLHACFFGEILAGPQMPALMYMLWFKDLEERTENWKKFSDHPNWAIMKANLEFANTVSVVNKKFLIPLEYSQI